jgi:hypothetical protein
LYEEKYEKDTGIGEEIENEEKNEESGAETVVRNEEEFRQNT